MTKIAGSGSISQRHGFADPDPHQNVMGPVHCYRLVYKSLFRIEVAIIIMLADGRLWGGDMIYWAQQSGKRWLKN
jgi:hypothetical protein